MWASVAEWVAPAATMIAAIMTAANLGARVTGWGFVVFTLGSLGWIVVGLGSDQSSLVVTNGFLTLVNVIGIWRWLGRQARYEAVGDEAKAAGEAPEAAEVVPASGLIGRAIDDSRGQNVGEVVETIIECGSGAIRHLVVRFGGVGGVGEQIVALPLADVQIEAETLTTRLSAAEVKALPRLDATLWPRLLKGETAEAA